MRLRETLAVAALWCCAGAAAAQSTAPASAPPLSASAVHAAAAAVRSDPLLPGKEKTKVLRFKDDADADEDRPAETDDAAWWRELFGSISGGMRVAMWLVGAGLLVWVLLRLRHWVTLHGGGGTLAALPPTHVGTLDIRPESLPADIGAAARALWRRGEARAALSLLYRGALSRLVHGHAVPIRAASTESECLALASTRLAPAAHAFLARLIAAWQAVAYAKRELTAEAFEQLCADFDACMATAAPAGAIA